MVLASAQSVLSSSAGGSSAEPSESDAAPRRRPKRHKNVALSSLLRAASFAATVPSVQPLCEPVVHIAPADVEEGVCVSVVFCCQVPAVNNRDTLYLQLAERQEQLQLLCELLEEEAVDQQLLCAPPAVGSCVLACWEGGWYRARVVRLLSSDDDVDLTELLYLDYGNTDCQSWRLCRRLTARHIAPPAFALRCQLLDVQYCPVDSVHRRLQLMVLQAVLAGDGDGLRACFHLPDEQSSSSSDGHHLVELSTLAQMVDKAGVVRPLVLRVSDMLNRVQHLPLDEACRQVESERVDLRLLTSDPINSGQSEQSAVDRLIEERRQTASQRRHRPQMDVGDWLRQMPVSINPPPPNDDSSVDFCPSPARSVSAVNRLSSKYRHMELKWDSRPNYHCALDFCSSLPRSDLLLVNVQSIDQFYLAEAQGDFERFQEELNATYGGLPLHPCQLPEGGDVKSLYTPGSYWVARWELEGGGDQSTQWCRATIVSADDLPTLQVFWVDYCEMSTVSAGQLRPISARLAARPVFVTRAFCADAAALPDQQQQSETTARFIELVEQPLLVVRTVRALSSDECLAVQLFTTDGAEVNSIAQILAREGLATVRDVQNDTECEQQTQEPQWQDVEDDVSSGAVSVTVQTNLRKEVLVRRQRAQLRLPGAGSVLYVRVTRLTSPLDMHVVLPFGVTDARYVTRHRRMVTHRLTSPGCLEGLAKEMRRHYGGPAGNSGGEFGRLRPLKRGAMVAVPWKGSWQRGRIAQLLPKDNDSEEDWASVTLVDWGLHTRASVADLRQLQRRFNDLPHQAVMCRCQEPTDGPRWTAHGAAEVLEHAQHGFLLADILAVDAHNVTITVQLYTAQGVPLLPR